MANTMSPSSPMALPCPGTFARHHRPSRRNADLARPRNADAWKDAGQSRDEQFSAKRAAVIRKAARAFSARGYHNTSLDDIAAETEYELTEIDIRSDPNIFEQYRYRIPVIIINGETLLEGRIAYRDLARAFQPT